MYVNSQRPKLKRENNEINANLKKAKLSIYIIGDKNEYLSRRGCANNEKKLD